MKNLFVMAVLTMSIGLVADDIICMGNSNTNQLIQIEVKLDNGIELEFNLNGGFVRIDD